MAQKTAVYLVLPRAAAEGNFGCVPGTPICCHFEREGNITRAIEFYNEKGLNL